MSNTTLGLTAADLNAIFKDVPRRAEQLEDKQLLQVNVPYARPNRKNPAEINFPGADLAQLLSRARNNTVVFGRRGTGKTHLLRCVHTLRSSARNLGCAYINLPSLNSPAPGESADGYALKLFNSVVTYLRRVPGALNQQKPLPELAVDYDHIRQSFAPLPKASQDGRFLVLLDEISELSPLAQITFLNHIKRTIAELPGFVIVIAAIRHGATFSSNTDGQRRGLELGADLNSIVDLDERYLPKFDWDGITTFYDTLIRRFSEIVIREGSTRNETVPQHLMTPGAFKVLANAAEGNPRDLLNILGAVAELAGNNFISERSMKEAVRNYFVRVKLKGITSSAEANRLFLRLDEAVIRRAKRVGFLLPVDPELPDVRRVGLFAALYDARLLHLLEEDIRDKNRQTCHLFKFDYGAYVAALDKLDSPRLFFWGDQYTKSRDELRDITVRAD